MLLQINKEKYKNRLKEERHRPLVNPKAKTMNSDQSQQILKYLQINQTYKDDDGDDGQLGKIVS